MSGGGGIVRGKKGEFLFAFGAGYGSRSNNKAELRAVHDKLLLGLNRGFSNIVIESDSKLVVDSLLGRSTLHWQRRPWASRISDLMRRGRVTIQLIHREGNGPVDGLARLASDS
ncbi:uncharacterized protein LOC131229843 [Magnolia sinica]|uniref:uncharacterized protein LOC131229843 n=1 Tax=Magnolia sinica TaxID=86752 RepID=UPI00265B68C8|nr:uncharacterized protein LOC131229843 [Magnolia sinica]